MTNSNHILKKGQTYFITFLFSLLQLPSKGQNCIDTLDIKNQKSCNYKAVEKHFINLLEDRNYEAQTKDYYCRCFDQQNILRLEGNINDHEGIFGLAKYYDKKGMLETVSQNFVLVSDINDGAICDCIWKHTPIEHYKNGILIEINNFYSILKDSRPIIIRHTISFNQNGRKISEKFYRTKKWLNLKYRMPIFRPLKFIYFDGNEKQVKTKIFRRNSNYNT